MGLGSLGHQYVINVTVINVPLDTKRRKPAAVDSHTLLVSVEPGLGSPSASSPPGSQWEAGGPTSAPVLWPWSTLGHRPGEHRSAERWSLSLLAG